MTDFLKIPMNQLIPILISTEALNSHKRATLLLYDDFLKTPHLLGTSFREYYLNSTDMKKRKNLLDFLKINVSANPAWGIFSDQPSEQLLKDLTAFTESILDKQTGSLRAIMHKFIDAHPQYGNAKSVAEFRNVSKYDILDEWVPKWRIFSKDASTIANYLIHVQRAAMPAKEQALTTALMRPNDSYYYYISNVLLKCSVSVRQHVWQEMIDLHKQPTLTNFLPFMPLMIQPFLASSFLPPTINLMAMLLGEFTGKTTPFTGQITSKRKIIPVWKTLNLTMGKLCKQVKSPLKDIEVDIPEEEMEVFSYPKLSRYFVKTETHEMTTSPDFGYNKGWAIVNKDLLNKDFSMDDLSKGLRSPDIIYDMPKTPHDTKKDYFISYPYLDVERKIRLWEMRQIERNKLLIDSRRTPYDIVIHWAKEYKIQQTLNSEKEQTKAICNLDQAMLNLLKEDLNISLPYIIGLKPSKFIKEIWEKEQKTKYPKRPNHFRWWLGDEELLAYLEYPSMKEMELKGAAFPKTRAVQNVHLALDILNDAKPNEVLNMGDYTEPWNYSSVTSLLGVLHLMKTYKNFMFRDPKSLNSTTPLIPSVNINVTSKNIVCIDNQNIFENKLAEIKEGALENVVLSRQSLSIITDWNPDKIFRNILQFLKIPIMTFHIANVAPEKIESLRFYVKAAVNSISTRMKNENLIAVLAYQARMWDDKYKEILHDKLNELKEWHRQFEKDLKKIWKKKDGNWVLLC